MMTMHDEPRDAGACVSRCGTVDAPANTHAPAVGDLVGGKYRIERVLGEGGMGIVVAARHRELGQPVAIKLVRAAVAGDAVVAERFLREARAMAQLQSPHVARVIDVGRLESGLPYLVMEYLDGADLARVLAVNGPLPLKTACYYVMQACEALAEAHALGIVHRDIKPENLFLARSLSGGSIVKVLDFGISKQASVPAQALTAAQELVGSPIYMAPELLRASDNSDARSDVWALGVVLYELLTGRTPYEADSLATLCLKIVREDPQPIDGLRVDLPSGLSEIVHRCLAKDPSERYANAVELAVALEGFATVSSGVQSARSSPGEAWSAARRRGWAAAALAIALAVCACLTGDPGNTADPPIVFGAVRAAFGAAPLATVESSPAMLAPQSVGAAPVSVPAAPAELSTARAQSAVTGPSRFRPVPHGTPRLAAATRPPDDDIPAFR
jgi:serine/threonine-protein kinase